MRYLDDILIVVDGRLEQDAKQAACEAGAQTFNGDPNCG